MNCVPDSAAAQHMETYIERKLLVYNYRRLVRLSTLAFKKIDGLLFEPRNNFETIDCH